MKQPSFVFLSVLMTILTLSSCQKNQNLSLANANKIKQEAANKVNSLTSSETPSIPDYQLVWSDEFNYNGLPDPTKWGNEIGYIRNNELQYYTNRIDNQKVANGVLNIISKKESYNNYNYTSASLTTEGKYGVQYGRIEARIKISAAQGVWPAFWMLGVNMPSVGWPACGEVDIMEHINTDNTFYSTVHWGPPHASAGGNIQVANGQYHVYATEWNATTINLYVDNTLVKSINTTTLNPSVTSFQKPFYIILNQAIGGAWPGNTVDNTRMPDTLKVDYVRVYKRNPFLNAGFESGSLAPWSVWNPSGAATITTSNTNSGTYAVQEKGGETSLEQVITGLKPNTTYKFGGYAKVAAAGQSVIIGVKNYGGSAIDANITSLSYKNSFVTFTTGQSNTTATVYFYKPTDGTAFGDDFYLTQ